MPGVYENKHQDSFPNVYCYVPWQSQFVLNGCLTFMKINTRTLFPTSTAMSLTVTVCSRWMPGIYFQKCQDSFPNIYCYVPWQSQFVLNGCLVFIFINARTLFPTSTAMSLTVAFCSRWMPSVYFHKCQDSFPNVYCYISWQSQFLLDGCLRLFSINARTLFRTSTAKSLDSRSFFSMDAWGLWK